MELSEGSTGRLYSFLKDTKKVLKIYMSSLQRRRLKIYREFRKVPPATVASFISQAQTLFTGVEYSFSNNSVYRKKLLKKIYSNNIVVLPYQLFRAINYPHFVYSLNPSNDEIYPELKETNYLIINIGSKYILYDFINNKINEPLIRFNPQFEDIVKQLIAMRLENNTLSMEDAMNIVIEQLKDHQYQR